MTVAIITGLKFMQLQSNSCGMFHIYMILYTLHSYSIAYNMWFCIQALCAGEKIQCHNNMDNYLDLLYDCIISH